MGFVIPVKTGIQYLKISLDSRFRGNDTDGHLNHRIAQFRFYLMTHPNNSTFKFGNDICNVNLGTIDEVIFKTLLD